METLTKYSAVPQCLRSLSQWVCWRFEHQTDGSKPKKRPCSLSGIFVSTTDPNSRWTFEEAVAASSQFNGIGFVFTKDDPYLGVDVDNCFAEGGEIAEWALPILQRMDGTYGEISPSGNGVKFIMLAKNPRPKGIKTSKIEIYDNERFFTITGNVYDESEPSQLQPQVDWLINNYAAKKVVTTGRIQSSKPFDMPRNDVLNRAQAYLDKMPAAISGSDGSGTALNAACRMVIGFALSGEDAYSLLANGYNSRCDPPWTEKELRHKIESAEARISTDSQGLGYLLARDDDASLPEVDYSQILDNTQNAEPTASGKTESEWSRIFDQSRQIGFISDVMEYNLATAKKQQPIFALASSIALMASIIGRKVKDEYGTRPNLQIISVGETGRGKDHGRQIIDEILAATGNEQIIGPEEVSSDTALYKMLESHPSKLYQQDEFGRFLKTTQSASTGYLYNVTTALMKLYTSANRQNFIAKVYADAKRTPAITICQPHLVLHATSTPAAIYESLGAAAVEDGFLGRCLVFESVDHPRLRMIPEQPIPASIIRAAEYWRGFAPPGSGNLAGLHPEPMVIETTTDANVVFTEFQDYSHDLAGRKSKGAALWERASQKARQLAIVFACSINRESPVIDRFAADWACSLARVVTRHMISVANDWLSSNAQESSVQRLLRFLKEYPEGITKSELTRKTHWLKKRERDEIIASLIEAGQVREVIEQIEKSRRTTYFPI